MPDKGLPDFPEKKLHIFNDVSFELLPEISYEDLVYLSQLVEQTGRKELYSPLVDCLRKIQWAKLASLEAIIAEKRISERATPDAIPFDPIGQVQHMKALFDFVAHSKAALDSLAIFFRVRKVSLPEVDITFHWSNSALHRARKGAGRKTSTIRSGSRSSPYVFLTYERHCKNKNQSI